MFTNNLRSTEVIRGLRIQYIRLILYNWMCFFFFSEKLKTQEYRQFILILFGADMIKETLFLKGLNQT